MWQRAPDIDRGGTRVRTVHLIQSNYGGGDMEIVAEAGATPYGSGPLFSYFFNTGAWGWRGPLPLHTA